MVICLPILAALYYFSSITHHFVAVGLHYKYSCGIDQEGTNCSQGLKHCSVHASIHPARVNETHQLCNFALIF